MFSSNASQVSNDANYIEDVFSTWLYTGNGSTQTVTNGIDLAGKGGLVWTKQRTVSQNNSLFDTVRGANNAIYTDSTVAQQTQTNSVSFAASGFSVGSASVTNANNVPIVSWTFRKQPKFFDVVTYTGTGVNRTVAHNLGSVPGCIIVKRTDTTGAWQVYHRSLANTEYMVLNTTAAKATGATRWNSTTPTSTEFSLGTDVTVNASGGTYIAYVFAHDAGGFGLSGEDNVISCGSFTTDGSGNGTVNLGYEPQWAIVKLSSASGGWAIVDSMRGNSTLNGTTNTEQMLLANSSAVESSTYGVANPTSTGFQAAGWPASSTLIYIAIRRGPMKVPTIGTSVFQPVAYTGTAATQNITGASFPPDLSINQARVVGSGWGAAWYDRLRGPNRFVRSSATAAENSTYTDELTTFNMNGVTLGISANGVTNNNAQGYVDWLFGRAPGFFDVVCYTGTGSARTVAHNLTVVPELMIVKRRNTTGGWVVYSASSGPTKYQYLNTTAAAATLSATWNNTAPTASVFTVGTDAEVNASGGTFVAYLFATCPGVSKVGSYTGTAATLQIDCGFTGGARFVLIKRTDSTGDWYVWDSARGIVAGNDPYLLLNGTSAEVTSTDYVDTYSAGFEITSTAPAAINAGGGTFIFLAIA